MIAFVAIDTETYRVSFFYANLGKHAEKACKYATFAYLCRTQTQTTVL